MSLLAIKEPPFCLDYNFCPSFDFNFVGGSGLSLTCLTWGVRSELVGGFFTFGKRVMAFRSWACSAGLGTWSRKQGWRWPWEQRGSDGL